MLTLFANQFSDISSGYDEGKPMVRTHTTHKDRRQTACRATLLPANSYVPLRIAFHVEYYL